MQKLSFLKVFVLVLSLTTFNADFSIAQSVGTTEQQIITLSKDKWQWMADKDVEQTGYTL